MSRQSDLDRGMSESAILRDYANGDVPLITTVNTIGRKVANGVFPNPVGPDQTGRYRSSNNTRLITVNTELMSELKDKDKAVPCFLEAGPRETLSFNPSRVRVAIVTAGGIAPGLNSVIKAIVQRHCSFYKLNPNDNGNVFGIKNGFKGLSGNEADKVVLTPEIVERWHSRGGTMLGSIRESKGRIDLKAEAAASCLRNLGIDILYVLGGDGSMQVAHELSKRLPDVAIACVPKTIDNDILWVWESFGFATAVEEATRVINTLHQEAESTRRICLIELFGAESGFIAANAAMASANVDLVLIPEVFRFLKNDSKKPAPEYVPDADQLYMQACIRHIEEIIKRRNQTKEPHAVIIVAEGVSKRLDGITLQIPGYSEKLGDDEKKLTISNQIKKYFESACHIWNGEKIEVFINEPRHNIRAVPANAIDQIYCERLGTLVVDCALAGYTDFMISQWLTEYVLVPLEMATMGQKSIYLDGVFWKQVMNITEQPTHEQFRID